MMSTPGSDGRDAALRVLVVEDDPDGAEIMRLLLRLYGHRVEVAEDGPAALAAARRFGPDVVLLDIGLPGMDGYEVARRLRDVPEGKPPLLVAVTGYGGDGDRALSERAGIQLHLVKPVDPEELQALLTRFSRAIT
jgi:CheY-like chemotaxis protein